MVDKQRLGVAQPGGEPNVVSLLGDVETAAAKLRALDERQRAERAAAVDELRAAIRVAHDEGVPFARIARTVGLSRERVRQLYAHS